MNVEIKFIKKYMNPIKYIVWEGEKPKIYIFILILANFFYQNYSIKRDNSVIHITYDTVIKFNKSCQLTIKVHDLGKFTEWSYGNLQNDPLRTVHLEHKI